MAFFLFCDKIGITLIKEKNMNKKAPFITIEGVDGAGKSSHIEPIVKRLQEHGFDVVSTREPGGTDVGEKLRDIILNDKMDLRCEILLAFASRADHLFKVIEPALNSGRAVLCDRFTDSTYAYQGFGSGGNLDDIKVLENMTHPNLKPDLTLVFDLSVDESFRRLNKTGKTPDKFESRPKKYFEQVRRGYLTRMQENGNIVLVNSEQPIEKVKNDALDIIDRFVRDWNADNRPTPSLKKRSP